MELTTPPAIDLELVRKYNRPGPRYTSYPPATQFSEAVERAALLEAVASGAGPLSLYVHLPFCESLCWFCGCNTIITRNREQADGYLGLLEREIALAAQTLQPERPVVQLHFGGGTPNFLTPAQITRLGDCLRQRFRFDPNLEAGVELDPRRLEEAQVAAFAEVGFKRASFGVQDVHGEVQKAVNRLQSPELNQQAMQWLRTHGFESVNIDLIYGLPHQTPEGFTQTLESVCALEPDRLAIFSYAHVPWMKPAQKLLERVGLPDAEAKLRMLRTIYQTLTERGFVPIGMDHFARPEDELVVAQQNGTLQRNFQGYSTRAGAEICAFGLSAISQTEATYRQNHKDLRDYRANLENDRWPIERGCLLGAEDRLRRQVILQLMCSLELDLKMVEEAYDVNFTSHFHKELKRLRPLEADGLVEVSAERIRVLPSGRLLIRNIAMIFDGYLNETASASPRFSKTI
ncbi:MAG: oxygen-independent coproporphyrinogen III oxidase [Opitutales bacterium]